MSTVLGVLGRGQAHLFDPEVDFNMQEYAIGGRLITVKLELGSSELMMMKDEEWRTHIRLKLANHLALAMLDQNLMETTSFVSPDSGRQTIAARCYLAPHDQVKILRVHQR
jgi:hypothetical protein